MKLGILTIFTLAILTVTLNTYAQVVSKNRFFTGNEDKAWRFGIGAEVGIPLGTDINNYSSSALAGSARLQYDFKGALALMLTSGYTHFFAKSYSLGNVAISPKDYGMMPVKVGAKYFVSKQFYLSGEVGPGFETSGMFKSTKFIFSPGIGIVVSKTNIDVGLRYENYSGGKSDNFGLVSLRVAYGFKL
ncbi:hypothetical protein [Mucilaginibacter ginkgonis]|uniref:Outer membrane protein with beta-barrel domain n=1 Tax=Mucilaginibacter ginkgonis TaxID=2682091 RepID=A0A6I4HYG0_9SPHI|nr:hypothetical protein [Mucilaginibacter ginkgonis]QQL51300.1 hypothetical protein GO620_007600 [Mucilaginibacter ginkgonis]